MVTVFERVRAIVVEELDCPVRDVLPESNLVDDLDADSLDMVELVMGIEEEFSTEEKPIRITDGDAEKIHTVQDIVDGLATLGVVDEEAVPVETA